MLVPIVIVSPAFPFKCCRYSQAARGTFRIVTPVSSPRHDGVAGLTAGILLTKPTSSSRERFGLNCLSCAPVDIPFLARPGSTSGAHQSVLCALLLLLALLLGLCALLTEGLTDPRQLIARPWSRISSRSCAPSSCPFSSSWMCDPSTLEPPFKRVGVVGAVVAAWWPSLEAAFLLLPLRMR
jgi:hypothetical protein